MISRKTAKRVAEAYTLAYSYYSHPLYYLNRDKLHDFLYEEDYESWFLNLIKRMSEHALNNRELKEFLMRLHTGESVVATQWTWEDRRKLGQRYLKDLAEDIINVYEKKPYEQYGNTEKVRAVVKTLKAQLELDVSLPRLGPRISRDFGRSRRSPDQMFVMIRKIISIPPRIFSIARAKMSMIRLYIASARLAILVAP